ncbi:aminoglycoside phosphotransferase family protein [Streptomyces sp. C10-9-1]|uniref:aminoglycoside phosphotransferase family protein n=1 Tax=Streptomyces sp. C10-9-1 TaxID=1859285 RepID=UPI002112EAF4|nr:aminoglycoside phosphotransferase family protein [Streptomyces sp. C10-9-1]MCQ6552512.1 aminoglycoside phosphotransferase family protein [Streptomyces sp. C10-9-1]
MAFEPPQRLVRALGGDGGWLGRLPGIVTEAVDRRKLDVERIVSPGGRSSVVLLVRQPDGTPAALKLTPPAAAPDRERAALAAWGGGGAARLLDGGIGGETGGDGGAPEAAAGGELLLERLHPEVSLRSLPEAKALLEAAGTVRRLWVEPPPGHGFETVAARTARQSEALRAVGGPLAGAALAAREELLAEEPEELLLHGNFRQGKVLAGDRAPWLAVGPEPVVGERAYELARLARDRVEDLIAAAAGAAAARRRVKRLADSLEVDRDRLRGWTLFRAVESGTRALADGRRTEAEHALEFAGWL